MQFLNPNFLYLMLIPIVLILFLVLKNPDLMLKVFSKETLKKLKVSGNFLSKRTRTIFLILSLILFIISLARPIINEKEQDLKQEVKSIIIAIDVSKSMLAQDLFPSRLKFAKQKVLEIIKNSKHNALGVVLFAKSSFILSPITQDFNSLTYLVNNLDTGLNFDNGSNILSVLEAANSLLKNNSARNIILLTDGGNKDSYKKEIEFANENNLKVYTIAVASNKPTPIPTKDGYLTNNNGEIVTVKTNDSIKNLSFQTKAAYINYSLNDTDIKTILKEINSNSLKDKIKSKKYKTYTELFYYPIILALLFLLIAFSSIPRTIKILPFLIFGFSSPSYSDILDFNTIKKAKEAYKQQEYQKANDLYKQLPKNEQRDYNIANSYYKNKEYKKAIEGYESIKADNKELDFKKNHNLGNSYVKEKNLEKAKEAYEKALNIKKDKETQENLEEVKKALKKQKKNSKDNKDSKKESKKSDKDKKNKEDKKDKKSKKDSKNKKSEKNDDKKKKEKKEKEKSDKNSSSKDKKQKKEEENKKGKKNKQKTSSNKFDKNQISKLEEKKWMDKLKEKNSPVFLRRFKSKNEDTSKNPW